MIIKSNTIAMVWQSAPKTREDSLCRAGRQDGKQTSILRLLTKRVGTVSSEVEARVKALSLAMLEELFDAALDFTQVNDLMMWLDGHQ
jgi:ABC-type molybdenum transport system ATPase subunit/photorepair protein PhrA